MANDAITGFGTTVTFASGFFAEVTDASWSVTREPIDGTHMGTTAHKFYQPSDVIDSEITLGLNYTATTNEPNWSSTAEDVVINWGNDYSTATNAGWAATGFLTAFEVNAGGAEETIAASATIKIATDIALTA